MNSNDNMLPWIIAIAAIGFLIYNAKKDAPPQDEPRPRVESINKVLDRVYKQDRSDRLQLLKELSTKTFANDQEKLNWINEESTKRRIQTNIPYTDRIAEAIYENRLNELIKQMESGR